MTATTLQRLAAEGVGTFAIVFAPVALAGAARLPGADASLAGAAWVSGLIVAAMIYTLGHVSSAHFNPAVSLALASSGRFPWRDVPGYLAAQLLGGVAAGGLGALLFQPGPGTHVPAVDAPRAVIVEAVLAFLLMLVIMGSATDSRAHSRFAGLAIGLVVVVDVWVGGAVTGGSMNPARSLGPALFVGGAALANGWVYVVGPVLGAVVAAGLYQGLRQPEKC